MYMNINYNMLTENLIDCVVWGLCLCAGVSYGSQIHNVAVQDLLVSVKKIKHILQ